MKLTVFGEVLWDIFDKERKIGGAPFNFAAHAVKQGCEVEFISAVGCDESGEAALMECKRLEIPTAGILKCNKPTGYCRVTLKNGLPDYELVREVAYDYISIPESCKKNDDSGTMAEVLCFGTLAQRGEISRATLAELLKRPWKEVFFDINIRQNFYSTEIIDESLRVTTMLKASREEVDVLNILGISGNTPEEMCRAVTNKYPNLKMVIITLDSDGAFVYEREKDAFTYSAKPDCKVVSTTGAGDAFGSAFLTGYLKKLSIRECIERASAVAACVVENLGAIPEYPSALKEYLGIE
ncbi:MAG: carbohydrate kinase family protein [Lachnospiraceae bacterium]|jgi:fructokinase